jgi:WD40 repeat protein
VARVTGFPGVPVEAAGNVAVPSRILTYPSGPASLRIVNLENDAEVGNYAFDARPTVCLPMADGRLLAGLDNGDVSFVGQGRPQRLARAAVTALAQHATSSIYVAGAANGQLSFFRTPGLGPKIVDGHSAAVRCLATHPDGNLLASIADDGTVLLWNVHDGAVIRTMAESSAPDRVCVFSQDGQFVVTGSSTGALEAFRVAENTATFLPGHDAGVNDCVFAGYNGEIRLITASDDATLNVLDFGSGRRVGTLTGHTRSVTGCVAVPHVARLVSWSLDRTIRLWDLTTYACLGTLYGNAPFVALTLLPNAMVRNESRRLQEVPAPARLAALDATGTVWIVEIAAEPGREKPTAANQVRF